YAGVDASDNHAFKINSNAAAAFTGNTTMGEDFSVNATNGTDSNSGWRQATKFTAGATGNLSSICVAFDDYDVGFGSDQFALAIYSDTGGTSPLNLLGKHTGATNVTITTVGSSNWNCQTLDASVSVTSGTVYWLAMYEN